MRGEGTISRMAAACEASERMKVSFLISLTMLRLPAAGFFCDSDAGFTKNQLVTPPPASPATSVTSPSISSSEVMACFSNEGGTMS